MTAINSQVKEHYVLNAIISVCNICKCHYLIFPFILSNENAILLVTAIV